MDGRQTVVAAGGAALIVANFWTGPQHSTIVNGLWGDGDTQTAHRALVGLGGEILFVGAATLLAGVSDNFGTVMVLIIVALFILWAMHQTQSGAAWTQRVTNPAGGAPVASGPTGTVQGGQAA